MGCSESYACFCLQVVCRVVWFSRKSMTHLHGSFSVWFILFFIFSFVVYFLVFVFAKWDDNPWVAFTRGKHCAVSVSMAMCKLLLWREGPRMLRYASLWQAEISAEEPCQICSLIHALPLFRHWPSPSDKQHRSRPCVPSAVSAH